jgi:1-acyl-sn-glycerol-3-phosphate acyltransferase
MLPPPIIRRLVFTPLLFALTLVVVVTFPVVYPLAALASLTAGGRYRAVRLLWFTLAWGTLESRAVLACLGPWLSSGLRGRVRTEPYWDRHYEIIRRYASGLYRAAERHLGLRIEIEEAWPATDDPSGGPARPVIVLSRHAGPGDALLLVHHLLSDYGRRPRVVMKALLQLDPCIDIAANRLPNVFVHAAGEGMTEEIERLAGGLGPADAMVIFPEGGNFTPDRRRRAIRRLVRLRRHREALRAGRMRNVMPPRPGGTLAAIDAAPGADVIFVAHSGLEDLSSVRDIWRHLPLRHVVQAHWWRVPAEEIPTEREAQIEWLYAQWERVDAWIGAQQAADPASRSRD